MQAPRDLAWKAATVHWKKWNDGTVVFNTSSGNTHLLTPTATAALKALEQRPAYAVGLAHHLASQVQVDSDHELTAQVEILLSNLDELGLIEPAS